MAPVRDRAYDLLGNPAELDSLLDLGADKAREAAHVTLHEARTKLGLD
jgi:tryptophanyl-tRNA synthetase